MADAIDFTSVPDAQRVAYYGLLFSIAAADGSFEPEEMTVIHSMLDLTGLSEEGCANVRHFAEHPPATGECLAALSDSPDELRHGTMMSLVDIALADGILTETEEKALDEARVALGVQPEQVAAMLGLIEEAADILEHPRPGSADGERIVARARALAESGVPHAAAYFSGTVARLLSVAPTEVASAMKIGLGRIPGAPISVIVGSTVRISVTELLRVQAFEADDDKLERMKLRRERAHEAIEHLQASIDELLELVEDMKKNPANAHQLDVIEARCAGLRQLVRTRRSALEEG